MDILSETQIQLIQSSRLDDLEYIQHTLPSQSETSFTDAFGKTLLHHAIERNSSKVAIYLIENHFCNILQVDQGGYQPLHWAASKGNLPIAQALLQYNAPLDSKTMYEETPFDIAKRFQRPQEILDLLNINSTQSLESFLTDLSLQDLIPTFQLEHVDIDLILTNSLTESDLKDLGVSKLGDRKRFMLKAKELLKR